MFTACGTTAKTLHRPRAAPAGLAVMVALAVLPLLASDVYAQTAPGSRFPLRSPGTAQRALPECNCRAGGKLYPVGTETCLYIDGINRVFRCTLETNVTSWRPLTELCPTS